MHTASHLLDNSSHRRHVRGVGKFTADERLDLTPQNSCTAAWTRFKRRENIIAEFSCNQIPSQHKVKQHR